MWYFEKTDYISNSQLRSFVKYDKFWNRLLTPDIYKAYYIDKTMEFEINDAIIVWKIVDEYFSWLWENVWNKYEIVSRRTWKSSKIEITKTMAEEAKKMIKWGCIWSKFQNFINDKDTESQLELFLDEPKIKWLPDFVNKKKKLIVDLKTSGNLDMIIDSLQFKWEPIFTANYIRQLAMYNILLWWWYDGALALITTKGVKWIDVPNWILEKTKEQLLKDIEELQNFIKNPISIDESIFKEPGLTL